MTESRHKLPVDTERNQLEYDESFWQSKLELDDIHSSRKPHLVFSLMVYLSLPIGQFFWWIFTSGIPTVKTRATKFLTFDATAADTAPHKFWPATLFNNWHTHAICSGHMHNTIIDPCIHHLVLEESDRLISNADFKISIRKLTIDNLRNLADPEQLMKRYQDEAPRTWKILDTFTSSPNRYRKEKARNKAKENQGTELAAGGDSSDEDIPDGNDNEGQSDLGGSIPKPDGFLRTPALVCLLSGSFLEFSRSHAC